MRVPYLSLFAILGLSALWAPHFFAVPAPAEIRTLAGAASSLPDPAHPAGDAVKACARNYARSVRLYAQKRPDAPVDIRDKDRLENFLLREVCTGRMPVREAQRVFAQDWRAAYRKYLGD